MTLVDTGPLVALVNRNDPNHAVCLTTLETLRDPPLLTTWACITEAMHLLYRAGKYPAQRELWAYIEEDIVTLHSHSHREAARMGELMNRYSDRPMDLADASLVATAEAIGKRLIFSLDSDFHIYRTFDGGTFTVAPGGVAGYGRRRG